MGEPVRLGEVVSRGEILAGQRYAVSRVVRPPLRQEEEVAQVLPLDEHQPGTVAVFVMVFPYLPPSKNQYDGWEHGWKSSAKRKWIRAVVDECKRQNLPKGVPTIGLSARLTFPGRGYSRDPQNYASTLWNFVPDALEDKQHGTYKTGTGDNVVVHPLRGYGLIPDDRQGRIQFGPNLGIQFAFDERKAIPKDRRKRTRIQIAVRMP